MFKTTKIYEINNRPQRVAFASSFQLPRKLTLLSLAYLDKGSSLKSQNEQSKRRKRVDMRVL